jgi:hypothetical protein
MNNYGSFKIAQVCEYLGKTIIYHIIANYGVSFNSFKARCQRKKHGLPRAPQEK